MKFIIDKKIIEKYPEYTANLIILKNIENRGVKKKIQALLTSVEKEVVEKFNLETIVKDEVMQDWENAFKSFGAKKYHNASLNLFLRVLEGKKLPRINPLVDLLNYISLKYVVPVGGENLDKVYGDSVLKFATGDELFNPIGSATQSPPKIGEVVWMDDKSVVARRWCWRQCERTKLDETVKNGYFIFDAFGEEGKRRVAQATKEFISLVKEIFGIDAEILPLNNEHLEQEIEFSSRKLGKVSKSNNTQNSMKKIEPKFEFPTQPLLLQNLQWQTESERNLKVWVEEQLKKIFEILDDNSIEVNLEHPQDIKHGDWSSNVAMKYARILKSNPRDIANRLVKSLNDTKLSFVEKVEVAGPGFINFYLKLDVFLSEISEILQKSLTYGELSVGKGKKVLVEHTSANPNKALHIGHVRNNVLGNFTINILENAGFHVVADYIINDRGTSMATVIWGYLFLGKRTDNFLNKEWQDIKKLLVKNDLNKQLSLYANGVEDWIQADDFAEIKSDAFVEKVYYFASNARKTFEWANEQVLELVKMWEEENEVVRNIWRLVLAWTHEGQMETLAMFGSRTDKFWYEHEFYKEGKALVEKGLENGVFKEDDGAVITNFEEYNIPNTVVIKSDGTALYITQDLRLTQLKTETFPSDLYIWVVGTEQQLALKQAFLADYQLGIVKDLNQLYHLSYGFITLKDGSKMSSRAGNVITADLLIAKALGKSAELIKEKGLSISEEELSKAISVIGIGALKYSILKVNSLSGIKFDFKTALDFNGNSCPYLQYTYARARSIMKGASKDSLVDFSNNAKLLGSLQEQRLIKVLAQFQEILFNSTKTLSSNLLADYLFELAQAFNSFYKSNSVLNAETKELLFARLGLVVATSTILEKGLAILGIKVLQKM